MFDGLKVLLVEDDPTVREGSEQALQLAGLDVLAFHSAELAYKLLTPDFPGIIVSDVRLPGNSAVEWTLHSRERGDAAWLWRAGPWMAFHWQA